MIAVYATDWTLVGFMHNPTRKSRLRKFLRVDIAEIDDHVIPDTQARHMLITRRAQMGILNGRHGRPL